MKKAMMATWSESEESSDEEKGERSGKHGSKEDKWFLDSGCSRHMTGDESKFAFLTKRKGGYVTFGDNAKEESLVKDWRPPWENCNLKTKTTRRKWRESKKEESPLALPPPQQVQGESRQDLPKDWTFVINHPQDQIIDFSKCMHSEFEMSMMGELNFFLGLQIKQLKEGTFINQAKYIKDLLKRFNMKEAKVMKTPMSSSIKLDMDEKESHLSAVKRILRYLKGTMNIGLWYPKGDNFELISFSDADFAGCRVERKSTSGTCHFLGHSLVSWHSKKQNLGFISGRIWTSDLGGFLFDCVPSSGFVPFPAQGKRPVEPSQPEPMRLAERRGRSVNFSQLQHFGFEGLFGRMGWLPVVTISEPVFPTLVQAFYSRATYGLRGPVLSTVRGVEIRLSPESICRILDIPSVGLRIYEAKAWPTVPGFEPREVVQRLCGLVDPQGMGKPSAHSLTVTSRVLHHMICLILFPRGGHRDEVSYLEAFIVDSILTGRRIHVGYLMMMHMISCVESSTRVLPYDRFLTCAFKDAGVDLSRETNFEAPTTYDTYDEQSLGCMKFEKAPDDSWVRKAERQARGHDQMHPGAEEEAEIREMEDDCPFTAGPSSLPSFTELPSQAPHVPDHAPWMDLSAQISSLGTRMEELALVHDSRFYSIEEHLDQYQVGFTSQFEHLVQRIERLESRQESQHEEMMAYLRSVFPHHLLSLEFVWDPPSFLFYVAKGGDIYRI
ncbi:Retrovirus-related Pol polyprotein from transposon RE1 [Vitis vinifera]|uniref:Retrovirus-related Pol polyprotein from transposon RE1 n=1 Tax=Vitis vinifera TaxID=29760 RepID=A0A438K5S4_VITVI|nr:Retrovirus-related Pol polyprotein from transposon RE1 [Vitis vinifera]